MKLLGLVVLVLLIATPVRAATITVDSLNDPGGPGICALRDAIMAANTLTTVNGCAAGDGNDTINFSVNGGIALTATLPAITGILIIDGPAGKPRLAIGGQGQVQIMVVEPSGVLTLNNLTIRRGHVNISQSGGCILNQGHLTINGGAFTDCTAGAIFSTAGHLDIIGTRFANNSGNSGGAIFNIGGPLNIMLAKFIGNQGGAVQTRGGPITISRSVFSNNTGASAVTNQRGPMTIIRSTFSGNSTTNGLAAGLYNINSQASIINSTFFGNQGGFGGAILNDGTMAITASTIASNSAGLANDGTLTLKSTILAANLSGDCDLLPDRSFTDAGYNLADDSSCAFTALGSLNNTDPMLDPAGLSNNGGPTETVALLASSPAVDVIPLASCTDMSGNPVVMDQRGFSRPGTGETQCSMAAWELQQPQP